ncbi:hypothetical protein LS70_001175 [Helicobacter sp. MIT 11-5569]|uniref:hypothetical protein n=1 Tax=Helicobacter sp. MIT 11-5569 TaxID=1548151 RepID=UPI00051F9A1A|nr:hypothetical protein [Helicobacter sp. MIT 11-5569]TLD85190.1 hypothetical protein LS70_001175 [Helicobacter sp. MIT 11-5569]
MAEFNEVVSFMENVESKNAKLEKKKESLKKVYKEITQLESNLARVKLKATKILDEIKTLSNPSNAEA